MVAVGIPYILVESGWEIFRFDIGYFRFAGIPFMVFGALTMLWCIYDFAAFGKGTLAPIDPPKHLVTRGFYNHVRNPMYVGGTSIMLGAAAYFQSALLICYALFWFTGWNLFVIFYEEPTLRKKFGKEYEDYCARVPRWIPRISR